MISLPIYTEGYIAYKNKHPLEFNPYKQGSKDAIDWEYGWYAAQAFYKGD